MTQSGASFGQFLSVTVSSNEAQHILNRSRSRAPNLRAGERFIAGLCTLFMKPGTRVYQLVDQLRQDF
jgi:hypothetical protein